MFVDHHIHFLENYLERPEASYGEKFELLEKYIDCARKNKVEILGFSEHAYLFREAQGINFNKWQEFKCRFSLDEYVSLINELKKKNKNILLGLEVDYLPQVEKKLKIQLAEWRKKYDFDFFIGSVHWIDGWGFDIDEGEYVEKMNERDAEKLYEKYFVLVRKMIESNLFDIAGHADLIKIFGVKSKKKKLYAGEIAGLAKKYGTVVEINTNGFCKRIGEQYPCAGFLQSCCDNGVGITFNSDAHKPERVGENFERIKKLAKSIGYDEIVYIKKEKKNFVKI